MVINPLYPQNEDTIIFKNYVIFYAAAIFVTNSALKRLLFQIKQQYRLQKHFLPISTTKSKANSKTLRFDKYVRVYMQHIQYMLMKASHKSVTLSKHHRLTQLLYVMCEDNYGKTKPTIILKPTRLYACIYILV